VENMQSLVDCRFISIKLEGFFCKMSEIRTILPIRLADPTVGNFQRRGHAPRAPFGARIVLRRLMCCPVHASTNLTLFASPV